jgi:transcriptional regulator with XRE-family HTH domain
VNAEAALVRARRRAGLTQRELAARTGVAQPAIARLEAGRVVPRVDTLSRLLRACGWDLDVVPRYGEGVDRSVIRELLALTPRRRLELAAADAAGVAALDRAARP